MVHVPRIREQNKFHYVFEVSFPYYVINYLHTKENKNKIDKNI
jgi:hypothetical protein